MKPRIIFGQKYAGVFFEAEIEIGHSDKSNRLAVKKIGSRKKFRNCHLVNNVCRSTHVYDITGR